MSTAQPTPTKRRPGEFLKDVFLFLVAPFVSLAYLALFPFIGLALLMQNRREQRNKRAPSA